MAIAPHSSSSPIRVGQTAVIEARFCPCGARKMNGYAHRTQQLKTSQVATVRMGMNIAGAEAVRSQSSS